MPGTIGVSRVDCSRVLRLTALNTRILGGHSIRVTGGCGIRLRIHSDLRPAMHNAVMGRVAGVRGALVGNITGSSGITDVSVINLGSAPNITFGVFGGLTGTGVGISVVLRSINHSGAGSVAFAIPRGSMGITVRTMGALGSDLGFSGMACSSAVAGISVINTNVRSGPKVTSGVFRTLSSTNVGVRVVSADRVGVSILVSRGCTSRTMVTIRGGFVSWFGRWGNKFSTIFGLGLGGFGGHVWLCCVGVWEEFSFKGEYDFYEYWFDQQTFRRDEDGGFGLLCFVYLGQNYTQRTFN